MILWVTVPRFCKLTGYSVDAVDAKRSQGVWPEGIMWKKAPDGRVLIHTRNYNRWVAGQVYAPLARKQDKKRPNNVVRFESRHD